MVAVTAPGLGMFGACFRAEVRDGAEVLAMAGCASAGIALPSGKL